MCFLITVLVGVLSAAFSELTPFKMLFHVTGSLAVSLAPKCKSHHFYKTQHKLCLLFHNKLEAEPKVDGPFSLVGKIMKPLICKQI